MKSNVMLAEKLRNAGFRASSGKLAVLNVLSEFDVPASISALSKKLSGKANVVTLYRALEDLTVAGLVRRVDLQHSHAHYELVDPSEHHHHLVCRICGDIEDVKMCGAGRLESRVLSESERFFSIETHTMEFFGVCRACIKK